MWERWVAGVGGGVEYIGSDRGGKGRLVMWGCGLCAWTGGGPWLCQGTGGVTGQRFGGRGGGHEV